jgi:hypothetical protein
MRTIPKGTLVAVLLVASLFTTAATSGGGSQVQIDENTPIQDIPAEPQWAHLALRACARLYDKICAEAVCCIGWSDYCCAVLEEDLDTFEAYCGGTPSC